MTKDLHKPFEQIVAMIVLCHAHCQTQGQISCPTMSYCLLVQSREDFLSLHLLPFHDPSQGVSKAPVPCNRLSSREQGGSSCGSIMYDEYCQLILPMLRGSRI